MSVQSLDGEHATGLSDLLAIGFGTTVAMWAVGYVGHMPLIGVPPLVFVSLMLVCLVVGGWIVGQKTPRGVRGGLGLGLIVALLNLLILSSTLAEPNTGQLVPQAGLWVPGYFVVCLALASAGAATGTALNSPRPYSGEGPGVSVPDWLLVFAWTACLATLLLISIGGLVTGFRAGMAVPDWPNSFGSNMFFYPFAKMTGGVFYEHAHRLLGSLVGLTTLTLAVLLSIQRRSIGALVLIWIVGICVLLQGVLGGLRVTDNSTHLAVVHGFFAHMILAGIIGVTVLLASRPPLPAPCNTSDGAAWPNGTDGFLATLLVLAILGQTLLGTLVRQMDVGLMIHLSAAMLVAVLAILVGVRLWGLYPQIAVFARGGLALMGVVILQLLLGGISLVFRTPPATASPTAEQLQVQVNALRPAVHAILTTAHQTTAAVLLAIATLLAFWAWRLMVMRYPPSRLMIISILLLALPLARAEAAPPCDYAVVVSKQTHGDPQWNKVVDSLVKKYSEKYHAQVIEYSADVNEALDPLQKLFPRYACFVAQPEEAGREFVVKVHRLTRKLDDDPYTDVLWGILTGYSAADALRIASNSQPLEIRRAAAGTGINLELFDEGFWFNEGSDDQYTEKPKGGKAETKHGFADAAKPIVDFFEQYKPQLFLTSGHATWRDWQIGFPPHQRGQFRCKDGVLYGVDRSGKGYPLRSLNPKVYLPSGNCLMGLIHDKQSMALAWLGSGGADQMIGYVVSTWYGRGGWGTRDYFFSEPGRYTLSEAFYFNNQSIVYQLQTRFPKTVNVDFNQWNIETDPRLMGRLAAQLGYTKDEPDLKDNLGLHWDRDTVAFYGDPAWEARLAPRPAHFTQNLSVEGDRYTFALTADADCSPGRPPAMMLPHRVKDIQIVRGQELKPLVTSKFIIVMEPGNLVQGKTCEVVFTAKKVDRGTEGEGGKRGGGRDWGLGIREEGTGDGGNRLPSPVLERGAGGEDRDAVTEQLNWGVGRGSWGVGRGEGRDLPSPVLGRGAGGEGRDTVTEQLNAAGTNRNQLIEALKTVPQNQREGLAFLIANMPLKDLESLSKDFLLTNVRLAYQARAEVPWGAELPDELFLNDVLPYASINERRDDWRKDFYERFLPIAKKCKTPGEAALVLNKEAFRQLDVRYSATKRPKPDQSPYESAKAKFASCTGLSVLVVDALRAVAIPARLVGTPLWTDSSGNHTWAEVWDGSWHVIGASESTQLDQTWFNGKAAKADPFQPLNRIYATSFARTVIPFPLVWDLSIRSVPAIDVTACYKSRRNVSFQVIDAQGKPATAAVTLRLNGHIVAAGSGRSAYEFTLAGELTYEAQLQSAGSKPHVLKIELPKEGKEPIELRL